MPMQMPSFPSQDGGPIPLETMPTHVPLLNRLLGHSATEGKEHRDLYSEGEGNDEETQHIIQNDNKTDVQHVRLDRFRRTEELCSEIDDGGGHENSFSSCVGNDDCIYDVCENIDDSMNGLHTCPESEIEGRVKFKVQRHDASFDFDHDWVLDGTDSEEEQGDELNNSKTRRRRKFGDAALDQMLGMLEIENASFTTSGSSVNGEDNSNTGSNVNHAENDAGANQEVVEFADFSQFDPENEGFCDDAKNNDNSKIRLDYGDDVVSGTIVLQNDVLYKYGKSDTSGEVARSMVAADGNEESNTYGDIIWSSPEYRPPSSIECLVSDLDAELDVTIKKCLMPLDIDAVGSEGSSSHDYDCANLLDALNEEQDMAPHLGYQKLKKEHKQPLLMSSLLLELLPTPILSTPLDPVESFTRRIQNDHMDSKNQENEDSDASQLDDEILEKKLADTIHSGYFLSAGEDCDSDYFDSIVLEEILSVPWPFHAIDLNEPFLDKESHPDSDESEKIDHINFDTYISNRLSELDLAAGEIMGCILSRVSQKEDAINEGVEKIFAAELDITTALVFAKSSREFLHFAKNGYPLDDNINAPGDLHNVVLGGLEVLHFNESRDRLRYLMETIDRISSTCDLEVQWWKDAKITAPRGFQKLVDNAWRLTELVRGEEVLNHALGTMRDRINTLPTILLGRVEATIADLFARILHSGEMSTDAFDGYSLEYETLLQSWLSCCHLRAYSDQNAAQQVQSSSVAAEWSDCILKILCFEASKASACSMIDSYYDERTKAPDSVDHGALGEIKSQVSHTKDKVGLGSLSHTLLVMQLGGGHRSSVLSSTFFHLSSRLVELMNLYCVALQWHKAIIDRQNTANEPISNISDVARQLQCSSRSYKFDPNRTIVSSMSSDKNSSSSSNVAPIDEKSQDETLQIPVPETLEFKRNGTSNLDVSIHNSMELIRRPLWKKCEAALIHLLEFYMSQGEDMEVQSEDGTDFATGNLRLVYDTLLQFTFFSYRFLEEDEEGEEGCSALENELLKLTRQHLRSVHIEAMKTTGTLLSHESWQLAPLELTETAPFKAETNGMNGRCDGFHSNATTMRAIYAAVGDLLLGSSFNGNKSEHRFLITSRSEDRGYRFCSWFAHFLESPPPYHSIVLSNEKLEHLHSCFGMSFIEFSSKITSLVEMHHCGKPILSILTQSSAGLMKWTARLLAIGSTLPLVEDDASAAVMTLVDLYILTVYRLCARSKLNEDVLIGFGRGTASPSSSSASVSLTMDADAISPLPREGNVFVQTQEFIRSSRKRLEEKFGSNDDIAPISPRLKDEATNHAWRLEQETAAAYSCFFVAVLVDVASKIFNNGPGIQSQQQQLWVDLKDIMAASVEKSEDKRGAKNEGSLEIYARDVVSIVPTLVTQATRFATVSSIYGKELILQIICCGRVWENQSMQEQSNPYVDDVSERSAFLWGYMSSSKRLPPPILQYTWDQLVRSAFLLLLEGFSKVPNCSTEGRSLMSMDLATLYHGLTPERVQAEVMDDYPTTSPPPHACREEMMQYVDTFIKVFYFPNQDIIDWIKENSADYHLDHCLSVITSKSAGAKDERFMVQGRNSVVDIYSHTK